MSVGTMTLYRFNGEEAFSIESATISYYTDEDGQFATVFRADAAQEPIQTLPDTEDLRVKPFAEVTLRLSKHPGIALLTGRSYSLPHGYDKASGEHLTNFYYCEHELMDDIVISVLRRHGCLAQLNITGTTIDVNHYDDSKPRTKIVIDAEFVLEFAS
jgi:hypothetical protein